MFHLMPIKLWRNVSSIMVLAAFLAAMAGTFLADGSIVVHWGENEMPNNGSCGQCCFFLSCQCFHTAA